jgi:hypothetical protein
MTAVSAEASDMDDEEFAECLANHVNDTTSGDKRRPMQTRKDVYNVNLTNPLGEQIQLTAWEQLAYNLFDWFR